MSALMEGYVEGRVKLLETERDQFKAALEIEQRLRADDAETIASLRSGQRQQSLLLECADKARDEARAELAHVRVELEAAIAERDQAVALTAEMSVQLQALADAHSELVGIHVELKETVRVLEDRLRTSDTNLQGKCILVLHGKGYCGEPCLFAAIEARSAS